jgi:hypothetical protein
MLMDNVRAQIEQQDEVRGKMYLEVKRRAEAESIKYKYQSTSKLVWKWNYDLKRWVNTNRMKVIS